MIYTYAGYFCISAFVVRSPVQIEQFYLYLLYQSCYIIQHIYIYIYIYFTKMQQLCVERCKMMMQIVTDRYLVASKSQDDIICINNIFIWLTVRVGVLLTCREHVYDQIISLRGETWVHKTTLKPPLFIEVPVPTRKMSGLVFCVLGVLLLPLSIVLLLDFRAVPIV